MKVYVGEVLTFRRLRSLSLMLEREWGTRPRIVLACSSASDEHWQIFHPDCEMPTFTITPDGKVEAHPDGVPSETINLDDFLTLHR